MPKDYERIRRNLQKMADQSAPREKFDQYLQTEGVTGEEMRAYAKQRPIEAKTAETLGLDPTLERSTILPLAKDEQGNVTFAWPEVGLDLAQSFMLPRHAMEGGPVSPEDAARFALDYAAPATAAKRPGRLGQYASKRELVKTARKAPEMQAQADKLFDEVEASGLVVSDNKYLNFAADIDQRLSNEGIDPVLHPGAAAAKKQVEDLIGRPATIVELMNLRRKIGRYASSTDPKLRDDRRLLVKIKDDLDDMVEGLTNADLAQGTVGNIPTKWSAARLGWQRVRKMETIQNISKKAETQASGYENGLRIGFKQLLDSPGRIRAFSKEEQQAMRDLVKGGTTANFLKLVGKLSFGRGRASNFLGGAIGMAGGAGIATAMEGSTALGIAVPPAIGYVAQKGAERATKRAAEYSGALASRTGRPMPQIGTGAVGRAGKAAMPTMGTFLPEDEDLLVEEYIRRALLTMPGYI